jgi:hypothetical protein
MRDGLYKVQFQNQLGSGFGVVSAQAGKLWGGDSALYYVGSFTENGNGISATVETNRHSNIPGIASVFGIDNVHITRDGTVQGDTINSPGGPPMRPG